MTKNKLEIIVGILLIIFLIFLSTSSSNVYIQDVHRARILNSLFSTAIVCDVEGKPVYVSDNITDQFGWTPQDIFKNGINCLMVSDRYAKQHEEKFKEAARLAKNHYLYANTPMRRVVPIRCKDGSVKQSAIRMFTTDINGTLYMYAVILPLDVFDTIKSWPTPEITE